MGRYTTRPSPAKVSATPARSGASADCGLPTTYAVSLPAGSAAAVAAVDAASAPTSAATKLGSRTIASYATSPSL